MILAMQSPALTDADVAWLTGRARRRWPEQDAEEIVQETCLKVCAQLSSYQPGNWRGWLLKVMRNCAATWYSGERRHWHVSASRLPPPAVAGRPDVPAEVNLIALIPSPYRLSACAVLLDGRTYAETAQQLGIPVGTVCSQVYRARRALAPYRESLWRALTGELEGQTQRGRRNGGNHGRARREAQAAGD